MAGEPGTEGGAGLEFGNGAVTGTTFGGKWEAGVRRSAENGMSFHPPSSFFFGGSGGVIPAPEALLVIGGGGAGTETA